MCKCKICSAKLGTLIDFLFSLVKKYKNHKNTINNISCYIKSYKKNAEKKSTIGINFVKVYFHSFKEMLYC